MNEDIDTNLRVGEYFQILSPIVFRDFHLLFHMQVKVLLDQYDTNGEEELMFAHFCVRNCLKIGMLGFNLVSRKSWQSWRKQDGKK